MTDLSNTHLDDMSPDDRSTTVHSWMRKNKDHQQLRATMDANPHLNAHVVDLQDGFEGVKRGDMEHHLQVLNRAQFFEPEKFNAYATAVGEHRTKNDQRGKGWTRAPGKVRRMARGLEENFPQGDLREHAERLGLVDKVHVPDKLDQRHFGKGD